MHDTTAAAAEAQLAVFRRLSPAARVALALEASDWLLTVARARPAGARDVPRSAGVQTVSPPNSP